MVRLGEPIAVPLDENQVLLPRCTDRDHQAPTVGELIYERVRNGRRRRGYDDARPRRSRWVAPAAVADADLYAVVKPKLPEPRPGARRELRDPLDPHDGTAHRGQDRGLVAGPRPDVQDTIARIGCEELEHQTHHERLTDRLARAGGKRAVVIRVQPFAGRDETLTWHDCHRGQDQGIVDAAGAELLEHPGAGSCIRVLSRAFHATSIVVEQGPIFKDSLEYANDHGTGLEDRAQ